MNGEEIAGRYRLIEPLGRGAMSSVWLAEDSELERRVAVKLLSPAADRARFEREARAAASLAHPNLCALYDYGESDGKPYMVLEYLPNGSLEERLQAGPLDDGEATRIATEMAAGLAHAHTRGLVHRDLKPANVLFDSEERAKIADFGIARMGEGGTLTEAGTVLGTASYISPEQAGGLPSSPASDVYSFGVILFRMLTGHLPFSAPNAMEVVRMHRDDEPPHVADFRPNAPQRLEALTEAALAKDPSGRPADGAALLRELRGGGGDATMIVAPAVLAGAGETHATRVIRPRGLEGRRAPGRTRAFLATLIGLALLGVGVAVAVVLTTGTSSGGSGVPSLPGLSIPTVATIGTSASTTTAATSTAKKTTTAAPTTHATTEPPLTATATTAPVTTAPETAPTSPTTPVTTSALTTTAPVTSTTTTAPVTTIDTTPTTTAP